MPVDRNAPQQAQGPAAGIPARAFTPIQNPVYTFHNDANGFKQTPQPTNVLERPPLPDGVDARLTSYGSEPPVDGLTPIVPMAGQTPFNVWDLFPA